MDGTLIDGETIDELAKAANVGDLVAGLTKRAMRGEMDFEEALRERVKLLKGLSVEEVNKIASEIPLMKGAKELIQELKKTYTIVIVTHNMQQAARISDYTAFFMLGELIEYDLASKIFTNPSKKITEDYITGRFG